MSSSEPSDSYLGLENKIMPQHNAKVIPVLRFLEGKKYYSKKKGKSRYWVTFVFSCVAEFMDTFRKEDTKLPLANTYFNCLIVNTYFGANWFIFLIGTKSLSA